MNREILENVYIYLPFILNDNDHDLSIHVVHKSLITCNRLYIKYDQFEVFYQFF